MTVFGAIRRIAKNIRNLALNDPKAWDPTLWAIAGAQSVSGETVTEYTALNNSAVWNAVKLISDTISSLPLNLYQQQSKRKKIRNDRVLHRVMHDQWNPLMTAMAGRWCMTAHILTWGNGYAEIVRNGAGEIAALWPITPNRVTPEMKDGVITYRIKMDGEPDVILPKEQILHVPGPGFDGLIGYSIISLARKGIGLAMAMETFGSLYFGRGTHPGSVVTHPGSVKDPKAMRNALNEVYSGLGQSQQLMFLEEGMKIEKIGIPPEDSQFLESRQFQIPEIARWFNLPPHKLKDLTRSSFSNIESEQISFVMDSILPWLIWLEQNYNMQLLTASDKSQSGYGQIYFKHVVEGLLRGDSAARSNFYRTMWNIGAMTINEIREKEDMNPDEDPLADELFVPANMVPLSKIDQMLEQQKNKQLPLPAEEKTDEQTDEETPVKPAAEVIRIQDRK